MLPYTYEQIRHLPHFPFTYGGEKNVQKSSDGGSAQIDFKIVNNAHFMTRSMRISYNTLDAAGLDDGVTHLSGILKGTQQPFFEDFIGLETIAVPGRQRTTAVAGDPGNSLHIDGMKWDLLWSANDKVMLELKNNIDFAQTCKLTLVGFHFPVATFIPPA